MDESVCDKHGIPICIGDLIRSPHYIGPRNKMHYLYHVIVKEKGTLFMVPTSHLEPSLRDGGGKCPLMSACSDTWAAEIISGYGPDPILSFEDRPRRKTCSFCGEPFLSESRRRTVCQECKDSLEQDAEEARCMRKQPE